MASGGGPDTRELDAFIAGEEILNTDAWIWDPLEWEDLRRSRRFSALAQLALRGTPANELETLAWHDPDLREDPNARALIDWIYKGRPKPKNTLSLRQQMRRGYRRGGRS